MSNPVHKIEHSSNYGRYEYLLQTPHLQEFLTELEARYSDEDYQIWTRQGVQAQRPGVHISRVEFNRPAILNKNAYLSVTQLKYLSNLSNRELMAKHGHQLVHHHFRVIEDYRRVHIPQPLAEKSEPVAPALAKNEPPVTKPISEKVPLAETKPVQKPKLVPSPSVRTQPPTIKATPKAAPIPKTKQESKRFFWQKTQHPKEAVDKHQTDLPELESENDRKPKASFSQTVRHQKANVLTIKEKAYLHRKKILVAIGLNALVFAGINFELNDDEPVAVVAAETMNWTPVKPLEETVTESSNLIVPHDFLGVPPTNPLAYYLQLPAVPSESDLQLFDDTNDPSAEEGLAMLVSEPDVAPSNNTDDEIQNELYEDDQYIAGPLYSSEIVGLLEEQSMEDQVAISVIDEADVLTQADTLIQLPPEVVIDEADVLTQADTLIQLPPEVVTVEDPQLPEVKPNLPIILVNQLTVAQQLEIQAAVEEVKPVVVPTSTVPKPEATSAGLTATLTEEQKDWLITANISESDWPYVDYIMTKESNWSPFLRNLQGGSAYGLCQRLMSVHPLKEGETYMEDPVAQLIWCDNYAHSRYGSWKKSYEAWKKKHWW